MRKWLVAIAILGVYIAPLRADITVVHTTTMEGGMAAMMPPDQLPKITMRIKGMKARADIEVAGMTVTSITDLVAKQVITLMPDGKTAQVVTPASVAAGGEGLALPGMDVALKSTGKTQMIDGMSCDEHTVAMSLSMAELGGAQMPPEALEAMKDVRMVMNGSLWIAKSAPGAAEYGAFNKAAMDSKLFAAISGMKPGQSGGLDKLFEAAAAAQGILYLTEMTMRFEGAGPVVEAMKQMGGMKMVQKLTSISAEPIADDLFKVPDGYTIEKK